MAMRIPNSFSRRKIDIVVSLSSMKIRSVISSSRR